MSKDEKIKEISKKAEPVLNKYGIKYAGVFGSYARGEDNKESDIDVLIKKGERPLSLFDLFNMKEELSQVLDKKVDLVSENAIVSYFRDYIFKDLTLIYGER